MRKWYVMVFTALALGLAWAIRGHFGHEWGAAWAGGCGGLALLVGMRDPRWMRRAPTLAALCAIGWGAGGIMSYGIVIGYCRGNEFIDVIYGFSMLAVIDAASAPTVSHSKRSSRSAAITIPSLPTTTEPVTPVVLFRSLST